jgi:hypothetical protein
MKAPAAGAAPGAIREFLNGPASNPPIEHGGEAEVLLAASGKAIIMVKERSTGLEIVTAVTQRALAAAPGADVRAAVGSEFPFDPTMPARDFEDRIEHAFRRLEAGAARLPSPENRFLRLPPIADCRDSAFPAEQQKRIRREVHPLSRIALTKECLRDDSYKRMRAAVADVKGKVETKISLKVPEINDRFDDLVENGSVAWLGILHADGNGLGQVFLDFAARSGAGNARDYIGRYRRFSTALDRRAARALARALATAWRRVPDSKRERWENNLPAAPLVLGGDDLTIVAEGSVAVGLARDYLAAFEAETAVDRDIGSVLGKAATACAGVAVVKPHFPFHVAYDLADDLIKSAKKVGKAVDPMVSAMDFHMMLDGSADRLDDIRARLTVDGGNTALYGGPYVVTENRVPERHWSPLAKAAAALSPWLAAGESERDRLPASATHQLRDWLRQGQEIADERYKLLRNRDRGSRRRGERWNGISTDGKGEGLFFQSGEPSRCATRLLDAMRLTELGDVPTDEAVAP